MLNIEGGKCCREPMENAQRFSLMHEAYDHCVSVSNDGIEQLK